MRTDQGGFVVKLVLFVIALIIILSLFKVRISSLLDNQYMQENFGFVWNKLKFVWDNYLEGPAGYIYNLIYTYIFTPLSKK